MDIFQLPSPIQQLKSSFLKEKGVELWVKRDDLIHQEISGNKWRKLKLNLDAAKNVGIKRLLTFGGAYSNHIAATAAAGCLLGFETIGIIRGDEGFENETLLTAKRNGMKLHFVSRSDYKLKATWGFRKQLENQFGKFYLIPEGGANELGVKGCEAIVEEIETPFDLIAVSAGTGTTAAGICNKLQNQELYVFPALKGASFIMEEMQNYCTPEQLNKVNLQLDYHFGGYGKTKVQLLEFMERFGQEYQIELDKVYTSKMFYGLFDLIEENHFKGGVRILAIHTGGLQGN